MKINEKNDCVETKIIMLSDLKRSGKRLEYSLGLKYETDIFNKKSKTTVCFNGGRESKVIKIRPQERQRVIENIIDEPEYDDFEFELCDDAIPF